jgi:hypothetical protein
MKKAEGVLNCKDLSISSESSANFRSTIPFQISVDRNVTNMMPVITGATGTHIRTSKHLDEKEICWCNEHRAT